MSGKRSIDVVEIAELPPRTRGKLLATIEPRVVLNGPNVGKSLVGQGEWQIPKTLFPSKNEYDIYESEYDSSHGEHKTISNSPLQPPKKRIRYTEPPIWARSARNKAALGNSTRTNTKVNGKPPLDDEDKDTADEHDNNNNNSERDLSIRDGSLELPPLLKASAAIGDLICFGMIHNANTNVLNTEEFVNLNLDPVSDAPSFYELDLSSTGHVFFVDTLSNPHFAVINEKSAKVLHEISQIELCKFRVYISTHDYASLTIRDGKPEKKIVLPVDIVIYGIDSSKSIVGQVLSKSKLYLQHPCYQDPDTKYDNPHVLAVTDLLAKSSLSTPSTTLSRAQTPVNSVRDSSWSDGAGPPNSEAPQDVLHRQIGKVFGSLTRFKSLKRLEADIRVITQLLPHQQEALDFMSQRELGPIPEQYSLWTTTERSGQVYYENSITGKREQERPIEMIGGILADDMGLGKTLTVLSTIIRTADNAKRQERPQVKSRATLVVVPSPILIDGWEKEVKIHCDGMLNIYVHHGRDRVVETSALAAYDIVLTTYHTIAAEALDPNPPLNRIKWFRLVLDEAHIIRRTSTKLHQAVAMLSCQFRWCLTGTPIQNKLEDLAALVAFIHCSPLDDLTKFRKHIITPVMHSEDQGAENLRSLLDSICLRRTKKLLNLPRAVYEDRFIDFSPDEKAYYSAIQTKSITLIKKTESQGRKSKDFGMLQLHLQLRRICNHGTFHKKLTSDAENHQFEPAQVFSTIKKKKCEYCKTKIVGVEDTGVEEDMGKFSPCGHLFCSVCFQKYEKLLLVVSKELLQCPICKDNVPALPTGASVSKSNNGPLLHFAEDATSSKISALMEDIANKSSEGKSIVFSCWTRSLDLVAHHLKQQDIPYTRIDGSCSTSERHRVLDQYEKDDRTRILLMTTGTGAVGLNLTVANCVYLLEPQWNPMVEKQAIARVLRLGQHRDVKVVRYFVNETYELTMRSKQLLKLGLAKHMDGGGT